MVFLAKGLKWFLVFCMRIIYVQSCSETQRVLIELSLREGCETFRELKDFPSQLVKPVNLMWQSASLGRCSVNNTLAAPQMDVDHCQVR